MQRLDRVVAIRTTQYLTEGKTYIVLGVKASGCLLLIATDKKERRYLRSNLFVLEELYFQRLEAEMEQGLEDRGF